MLKSNLKKEILTSDSIIDNGLRYKYDVYYIKEDKKAESLRKAEYRKIAIRNALIKFCGLNKSMDVLDVGCSQTDGLITQEISKFSKKIIGIDIDEEEIRICNKKNKEKNCKFITADARDLSLFDNESFDLIVITDVLEHLPSRMTQCFTELRRLLKKRGRIYLTLENKFLLKEPHYGLYFLSWLPKNLADTYVKKMKRGRSFEINHIPYKLLKWLCEDLEFKFKNITLDITSQAKDLGYKNSNLEIAIAKILNKCPKFIQKLFYKVSPEWVIVLEK